jgi:hypothetical protein
MLLVVHVSDPVSEARAMGADMLFRGGWTGEIKYTSRSS